MSCLAWNYHGFGNLYTGRKLIEIIRAKDLAVVFLAETLIDDARLECIQRSIGFDHRWVVPFDHRWVVPRVGRGGGLVLYWKALINLTMEDSNRYYIDAVIGRDHNLIQVLKVEDHNLSPLGLLVEDVKLFAKNLVRLSYSHIKRSGNSVAHKLAKHVIHIPDFQVWMEDVPSHVVSFLHSNVIDLA